MAVPSIEESRTRLWLLIKDAWQGGEPYVFPALDRTPLRGMSLYAHVDHAVRLTKASLALADAGLYLELVPLVRMALECAVTASWYAVTPDSGDAALREATRLKRALVEGISGVTSEDFEESLRRLDADLEELKGFRSNEAGRFEARCNALEGGAWMYVIYRELSTYSHAGALLLDHYLQEAPGTSLGFEYTPDEDEVRAQGDLATLVFLLHIALSAWELAVPNPRRKTALDELAAEAQFTVVVARAIPRAPAEG